MAHLPTLGGKLWQQVPRAAADDLPLLRLIICPSHSNLCLASNNLWHFSVLNALIYVKYDTGHNMQKHFNQLIICTALRAKRSTARARVRASWVRVLLLLLHVNNSKSCSCEMWHLNNTAGGCTDSMHM